MNSPFSILHSQSPDDWENFLKSQRFSPFLQSWTMGEVYRDIGQEPIRLEAREDGKITGICQAIVVPARRGRHLMVQYGPIVSSNEQRVTSNLLDTLKQEATSRHCSFIRMSPFLPEDRAHDWPPQGSLPSPLHLLAEYIWYLPLKNPDPWGESRVTSHESRVQRSEEEIFMQLRKTTRNLIRRAEKEGVTVELSMDPARDAEEFIRLHDETRKRHHFTPYSNAFFRAQVKHFAKTGQVLVYIAKHEGQTLATSIHMQFGGETSYHHGASALSKIPASYLLQWRAIQDALKRGDDIYNFWGVAPLKEEIDESHNSQFSILNSKHPFAGVTTFKTGFGGKPLPLVHCIDVPLASSYKITRAFEFVRKWRRGF